MILERSTATDIEKKAKEEGMITLKQDGYLKVCGKFPTMLILNFQEWY